MRLIDADAMIEWYKASFPFDPSEVRFSINDIESNMFNIPTVNPQIPMPERLPGEKGYYLVTKLEWVPLPEPNKGKEEI